MGEIKDVNVRRDGDVRVITLDGATWRIRITLTPEGVRLIDADTGTVLWKQDLASLDIRYREGKYYPEKKERDRAPHRLRDRVDSSSPAALAVTTTPRGGLFFVTRRTLSTGWGRQFLPTCFNNVGRLL